MRLWPLAGLLLLSACDSPTLKKCEAVIKATLKAPSSYTRIAVDEHVDEQAQTGFTTIDYDAVNLFNVPLRGHGECYVTNGKAKWFEVTPS